MNNTVQRSTPYPVADADRVHLPQGSGRAYGLWTGETRPPLAGEWFLSGAIIEAYRAASDMSESRPIAHVSMVERTGKRGTAAQSVGYRHGFDGIKFSPIPTTESEYRRGYALGVLDWCWCYGNTIDPYRAELVEGWMGREDGTLIDACLRVAGVQFDWRKHDIGARAAALRPLVDAAISK